MFVPIELSGSSRAKSTPWVTWALIAANTAIYMIARFALWTPLEGLMPTINFLGYFPGQFTAALAHGNLLGIAGAIINLITHQFIHSSFLHLFFNMVFLYTFGQALEREVGSKVFVVGYLLFGLVAAIAQSFVAPDLSVIAQIGHAPALAGASGAILGLLGAYVAYWPKAKLIMPPLPPYPIPAWGFALFFFFMQAVNALTGAGGVGYVAHAIGFITGFLAATYLPRLDLSRHTSV